MTGRAQAAHGCRNFDWHDATVATLLPPALVAEGPWDILIGLFFDSGSEPNLDRLASLASLPRPTLNRWLAILEQEQLITGTSHQGKIRALLSPGGRRLLTRYLLSTGDLQMAAHARHESARRPGTH